MKFVSLVALLVLVGLVLPLDAATASATSSSATHGALYYLGIAGGLALFGATLSATHPTLLDFKDALDPNDRVAAVIEVLNQTNEILDDMVALEGNLLTGNQTTVRTGIPAPTWRKLYGGVQPSKSTRTKVVDDCGMLENYAEVDQAEADLNGNAAMFRASETIAVLEGFNQEVAGSLFYGNSATEPEAFTGIAPRLNSLSAENADHIVVGGSADTDNTSIYLVGWGPRSVFAFYPKGSKTAGFTVTDKGVVTKENIDGNGGMAEMYRTHYRWDIGLAVPDWRYIVRGANIEVSALTKAASAGADLIDVMTQMLVVIHSLSGVRPAFYCNRTAEGFLRRQMNNKIAASTLTTEEIGGKKVMTFAGVPVRRCDAITNTEALVA
jgi:hypothetical protein